MRCSWKPYKKMCISFPSSPHIVILQTLCNRMAVGTSQFSPEAFLFTKTAKIVSRSNDYQKLIVDWPFCVALNHLASVASICVHSHHVGPQAFSYEWHPCISLISWAQPHIIEICRLFFFLSFFKRHVPLLKAVLSKRPFLKHWAVEKNHLWLAFQLNCHD